MIRIKLIGGPLDGQVREIPSELFRDGRRYISFTVPSTPQGFSARGDAPFIATPLIIYEYRIHRIGNRVGLIYDHTT